MTQNAVGSFQDEIDDLFANDDDHTRATGARELVDLAMTDRETEACLPPELQRIVAQRRIQAMHKREQH